MSWRDDPSISAEVALEFAALQEPYEADAELALRAYLARQSDASLERAAKSREAKRSQLGEAGYREAEARERAERRERAEQELVREFLARWQAEGARFSPCAFKAERARRRAEASEREAEMSTGQLGLFGGGA